MVRFNLMMRREHLDRVRAVAKREGCSASSIVREAVAALLVREDRK